MQKRIINKIHFKIVAKARSCGDLCGYVKAFIDKQKFSSTFKFALILLSTIIFNNLFSFLFIYFLITNQIIYAKIFKTVSSYLLNNNYLHICLIIYLFFWYKFQNNLFIFFFFIFFI